MLIFFHKFWQITKYSISIISIMHNFSKCFLNLASFCKIRLKWKTYINYAKLCIEVFPDGHSYTFSSSMQKVSSFQLSKLCLIPSGYFPILQVHPAHLFIDPIPSNNPTHFSIDLIVLLTVSVLSPNKLVTWLFQQLLIFVYFITTSTQSQSNKQEQEICQ